MGKPEIEGGFVLLARRITKSSLNKMRPQDFKVAINLLAMANYQDEKFYDEIQHKEIIIREGDVKTTHRDLARICGISKTTIGRCVRRLTEHGFIQDITPIHVKAGHGYSLYRIRKYPEYQDVASYVGSKVTHVRARPGPDPGQTRDTSSKQVNTSKQEKKGEAPSSSLRSEENPVEAFMAAWQLLHCRRWVTDEEYLLSGFEKRDLRSLLTADNLETYLAYAYHYHHDNGVGIRPGEKAPKIDDFLNRAAPGYCSTLREGTIEWRQARTFAREFLAERAAKSR